MVANNIPTHLLLSTDTPTQYIMSLKKSGNKSGFLWKHFEIVKSYSSLYSLHTSYRSHKSSAQDCTRTKQSHIAQAIGTPPQRQGMSYPFCLRFIPFPTSLMIIMTNIRAMEKKFMISLKIIKYLFCLIKDILGQTIILIKTFSCLPYLVIFANYIYFGSP